MRVPFFPKLAISGMKKNRQIYVPYLLTCMGTVMTFYILHSLGYSPLLKQMRGGRSVETSLGLGQFVIAFFSVLFLLYSNSFLNRRRYKEFGLYHVLGMGKKGLRRIIFWESLFTMGIGLFGGLLSGILFSKMSELLLAYIMKADANYDLHVDGNALLFTVKIYAVIFLILMVKSLITVQMTKALELFHSENLGEKPPRTNWILTILGLGLLGAAYWIAVSIKSPLSALATFFIAVIMVIVATYFLFIAGSVALCRILKDNKKYYYQKQHFVSVSSMVFRMRRNGAGLASICILCTMVLVMLSSTSSMYFGMNDAIETRFCREGELAIHFPNFDVLGDGNEEKLLEAYGKVFEKHGVEPKNVLRYVYAEAEGLLEGSELKMNPDGQGGLDELDHFDKLRELEILPLRDYNRLMGTNLTLGQGEAYLYEKEESYQEKSLSILGVSWKIKDKLTEMFPLGENEASIIPSLVLIVSDEHEADPLFLYLEEPYDYQPVSVRWYYGYDLGVDDEKSIAVYNDLRHVFQNDDLAFAQNLHGGYSYYSSCLAQEKDDFIGTYGGLFFLGIVLSVLFVAAMVLIIYYKQISEGYEDQSRFEIMQKVGMTKQDIKKSINSQILTVFFAPLILAGIHLGFAYPLIWKILQLLFVKNLKLLIGLTVTDFILFGIFYAVLYKLTSRVYYKIVSGGKGD